MKCVLSDLNGLSEAISSQTLPAEAMVADGTRIVATEVCTKRGCARSIVLTNDPGVSMDALQQVNLDEGITRFINLRE